MVYGIGSRWENCVLQCTVGLKSMTYPRVNQHTSRFTVGIYSGFWSLVYEVYKPTYDWGERGNMLWRQAIQVWMVWEVSCKYCQCTCDLPSLLFWPWRPHMGPNPKDSNWIPGYYTHMPARYHRTYKSNMFFFPSIPLDGPMSPMPLSVWGSLRFAGLQPDRWRTRWLQTRENNLVVMNSYLSHLVFT